ncbi:PREDICTED: synaptotagmin-3 [Tarenaya hassleriana]|uniref:synaptotagmin-3 n=1 Tax=Tarenaya hassleriana TaxID=28532 RepID=UPI00053C4B41|nr:PREDICTED: synaptotagmin-3 [Tarenaya hassleriana]
MQNALIRYRFETLIPSGFFFFVSLVFISLDLPPFAFFFVLSSFSRFPIKRMGFLSSVVGIFGFVIGIPIGLIVGFLFFVYSKPTHEEYPPARPIVETSTSALLDLLPDIPLWMKNPDYERVDWFNRYLSYMWPYLDKAICRIIRSSTKPIFADYIGMYLIESIEFENLSLGTLPPTVNGVKVYETNEKELVIEPVIRWAGNPNIVLVLKLLSFQVTVQLVDLQVFATPRVALKPLVPTFPCFAKVVVSLMEKPHVDFGLKVLGGDLMSIPGLYRYVQETIKKQIASLYHWPQVLEIPILDASTVAVKKPVGLLHVNIIRARNLLKKDLLGTSDPYVKLSLTGEKLPAKKTTIKKRNLNPEWNEHFKLIVKDPVTQVLQLEVFDWDKVGGHDRLGMQLIPLHKLTPGEKVSFVLDLLKNSNIVIPQDKKRRGRLELELRYVPFREESMKMGNENLDQYQRKESRGEKPSENDDFLSRAGLLSVIIQTAEDIEGKKHTNPFALLLFRGEKKKTKMLKKTRDPRWNEEFQFTLEEPPLNERLRIEVMSRGTGLRFRSKEPLGHVEINLDDVVENGRINQKYHLINSRDGVIHVEIRWTTS